MDIPFLLHFLKNQNKNPVLVRAFYDFFFANDIGNSGSSAKRKRYAEFSYDSDQSGEVTWHSMTNSLTVLWELFDECLWIKK